MKTVKEQWEEFEKCGVPVDAPPMQRRDMKTSFYAGAFSVLGSMASEDFDNLTEDEAISAIEGMYGECTATLAGMVGIVPS